MLKNKADVNITVSDVYPYIAACSVGHNTFFFIFPQTFFCLKDIKDIYHIDPGSKITLCGESKINDVRLKEHINIESKLLDNNHMLTSPITSWAIEYDAIKFFLWKCTTWKAQIYFKNNVFIFTLKQTIFIDDNMCFYVVVFFFLHSHLFYYIL